MTPFPAGSLLVLILACSATLAFLLLRRSRPRTGEPSLAGQEHAGGAGSSDGGDSGGGDCDGSGD